MSALQLIPMGIASGLPIVPYIYGASHGTPSPCRPDKVAIALRSRYRTFTTTPAIPAAPGPERPPPALFVPGTSRCGDCGYLYRAPGHKVSCGGKP